jgi:hypothetical protein
LTYRNSFIVDFVNQNQPRRFSACRGGQVIGLGYSPSQKIDVLVTHDSTIEFRADQKSYRVAEAILAGIAVKSDLTKKRLKEDFLNLASIPKPAHEVLKLAHPEHDGLFEIYAREFPLRMIVGWAGATSQTLLSALNEAVSENPAVPVTSFPDVVTGVTKSCGLPCQRPRA